MLKGKQLLLSLCLSLSFSLPSTHTNHLQFCFFLESTLSTFGMVVIGVGFATAFIPTFEALLIQVTEKAQYPDDVRTYSLVSGLWSSLFAMG